MAMSEIVLIFFVALMLFGSKNIPEIARTLGKGMAQIKNATNDIKSEIQKSADLKDITDIKNSFQKDITDITTNLTQDSNSASSNILNEINKVKEDIEDLTGPIKRQR